MAIPMAKRVLSFDTQAGRFYIPPSRSDAMPLGLAKGKMSLEDIIYFS